jgi:HlyD family secretion protein
MQLHLDIDEADVGQIAEGQEASFTVDAYPGREFTATITSVRYAPRTEQGVVTYEAILTVDNEDLMLRPGMTATASIVTARRANVLLVPNGALRFTPPGVEAPAAGEGGMKTVWTLRDGEPAAVPVKVGLSDGLWTEVAEGDVMSGDALLVDLAQRKP